MHRPPGLLSAIALPVALAVASTRAAAQQEFTLGEDDTWVETQTAEPAGPAARLDAARRALAGGQAERAEFLATQWIDRHERHGLLPEAYLVRGDALMAQRSYYEALFDYEYIARMFAGSEAFVTALQRELQIATTFVGGTKRKLWGMRIIDASDEAEELLIRIQERLPGSQLAEEAGMTLGDFYFGRRRMELAAEMYAIFIENYPRSVHVGKARKRLIYAHLAGFKGPEFDAAGLYEARARLRELRAIDPVAAQQIGADALLTRIEESDARKLLVTARWYQKTRDFIAAELTIRRLLRQYPRSVAAADGVRLMREILPRLPERVLSEAPDYDALEAAILGAPLGGDSVPPDAEPPGPGQAGGATAGEEEAP